LNFLGLQLDPKRNRAGSPVISRPGSPVTVRVMHTDEEWIIARTVGEVLKLSPNLHEKKQKIRS
jgi:acetate kinase